MPAVEKVQRAQVLPVLTAVAAAVVLGLSAWQALGVRDRANAQVTGPAPAPQSRQADPEKREPTFEEEFERMHPPGIAAPAVVAGGQCRAGGSGSGVSGCCCGCCGARTASRGSGSGSGSGSGTGANGAGQCRNGCGGRGLQ